jgi:hypothetical protein
MSDDNNNQPPPSFKPPERGSLHYRNLQREIVGRQPVTPSEPTDTITPVNGEDGLEPPRRHSLFTLTINAELEEGAPMTDPTMLLYMAFKPLVPDLKLNPEQTQLILAYMHEILREAEIEEQVLLADEDAANLNNLGGNTTNSDKDSSCK